MTFIDLFCGCGGFSLGMQRAGFKLLAAIDFNDEAITTFKANFDKKVMALRKDLTTFTPDKLAAKLGVNHVDVIVGGPPCQGFSTVRQVDAANHGSRVRKDKRRYLFRSFLNYVSVFRPKVFVMENVMGIQSAAKGKFFTLVQSEARKLGYRVHGQVEEAWKLGVPQKRRRQLVIGVLSDIAGYFPTEIAPARRAANFITPPTLWDAIGDLPSLAAGAGNEESDYDIAQRKQFLIERGENARTYLEEILEIGRANKLMAHRARPHSDRDLGDFGRIHEGETADAAIARGEVMAFPYDRSVFLDRYTRQHREKLCSTIVAHLAKDGLMFIHPTQLRSLTPREAARIQSFPDWFQFPIARTHQFRVIGNAVPPLVAEAVGEQIERFLNPDLSTDLHQRDSIQSFQQARDGIDSSFSPADAAKELQNISKLDRKHLRELPAEEFLRGWRALLSLFPGLHPDNALDHGDSTEVVSPNQLIFPAFEEIAERYVRSGWPVVLEPLGLEAWRRFEAKEFSRDEFYCLFAQQAGMSPSHSVTS